MFSGSCFHLEANIFNWQKGSRKLLGKQQEMNGGGVHLLRQPGCDALHGGPASENAGWRSRQIGAWSDRSGTAEPTCGGQDTVECGLSVPQNTEVTQSRDISPSCPCLSGSSSNQLSEGCKRPESPGWSPRAEEALPAGTRQPQAAPRDSKKGLRGTSAPLP